MARVRVTTGVLVASRLPGRGWGGVLAAQRAWVTACRFSSEASMAAAVARGCSMGKRWLPSSIMVRPWVTRCVMAMPTWRISFRIAPADESHRAAQGWVLSKRPRLWGRVL